MTIGVDRDTSMIDGGQRGRELFNLPLVLPIPEHPYLQVTAFELAYRSQTDRCHHSLDLRRKSRNDVKMDENSDN
jgi:hypothetical protein